MRIKFIVLLSLLTFQQMSFAGDDKDRFQENFLADYDFDDEETDDITDYENVVNSIPLDERFLKKIDPDSPLKRSYFFLGNTTSNRAFCQKYFGNVPNLPGWVAQELISVALFGDAGHAHLRLVEQDGGPFLWATEFSNIHSTFDYEEKPICIGGEKFPGPEQYFQIMKSSKTNSNVLARECIMNADPIEAFRFGNDVFGMRPDWDQVKDGFMLKALNAKFSQHVSVNELLLSTGKHRLVQIMDFDSYWGTGEDGGGQNKHGVILMKVREILLQARQPVLQPIELPLDLHPQPAQLEIDGSTQSGRARL